jgi:Holliday junction resolvase RusA-like endonuclease
VTVILDIFIPGIPKPGGSKRAFKHRHTDRIIVTDDAKGNADWKRDVKVFAHMAHPAPPLDGPLAVSVVFIMPRPKWHFGTGGNSGKVKSSAPMHPTTKPDATKLWRSTEDALTGVLWLDDAQVVEQSVKKIYGDTPGAQVTVWQLTN